MLRALYPPGELRVALGVHPVGALRSGAARALNAAAVAGVAYVFVGKAALDLMQLPEPAPLLAFRENRLVGLAGYFVCNWLGSQLKSSGAFEVAVDGVAAFSKLRTGRPAAVEEVLSALAAAGVRHDAAAADRTGFSYLNTHSGARGGGGGGGGGGAGEADFEFVATGAAAA